MQFLRKRTNHKVVVREVKAISLDVLSSLIAFWKEMSETQKNCHSWVEVHKLVK